MKAENVICFGDKGESKVLRQGLEPRLFKTFRDAEREAERLNRSAENAGVPWRYWASQRQSNDSEKGEAKT